MKTNVQKVMKFFFSFLILFGCTLMIHSQTLTYRVTSPKIGRTSTADSLEFNIEVKSSVAHYVDMVQANFYYNTTAFGTNLTGKISAYAVTGWIGNSAQYELTPTIQSGHLNIAVVSLHSWSDGDDLSLYYGLVTTSWKPLVKLRVKILDNTVASGIYFYPTTMNVTSNQVYVDDIGPNQPWGSIAEDETRTLQTLYLGRVFSGMYNWSQVGGSVDWAAASINTSVWDTLAGPATITGFNSQANKLRIHAGAALKIVPGGELQVTTTTEINQPRGLWIASTGAGSGAFMDNGEGSVTYPGGGYARIDRYVPQNQWHMIGLPLHTVNPQTDATFKNSYLMWYDEAKGTNAASVANKWTYITNEGSLSGDLKGWSHYSRDVWTGNHIINFTAYTGVPIVSGTVSRSLTRTAFLDAGYDGWNLVANMYPCPIDWEAVSGWTKTAVDNTIYYWNEAGGNYPTWNGDTHVGTLSGTCYIPSLQGFFVHVTSAGTLAMNNSVKDFDSQAFWKDQVTHNDLLALNVDGNGYKDEAKVWFNNSATVNFEPEYDNYKLIGSDGAPQFYSQLADGNIASINTLPWGGLNTVVPMGFSLKADAPVTITASNMESFKPGTRIYLEDIKEASMNELTINPVYTFTASSIDDASRFVLHFYNPSFGIEDKNLAGMQIYSFEDYVYVRNLVKGTTKGTIQIYDPIGRKVFESTLKDMELNKYLPGINEGYYMVRVVTVDNAYSKKIYLK